MSTNEELRRENELLSKAVTHWKANHDNRVLAARFLIEGEHVPLERVTAYEEMVRLQAKVAELERKRAAFLETINRFEEAAVLAHMELVNGLALEEWSYVDSAIDILIRALRAQQKIEG